MYEKTIRVEIRRSAMVGWEVVIERVGVAKDSAGERFLGTTGSTKYACPTAKDVTSILEFALEN